MNNSKPWTMVDSHESLKAMLDEMTDLSELRPDLFIDLEGEDLSRTGKLAILQILLLPKVHVYLVDCIKLGKDAFQLENKSKTNLKAILESATVKKAIFDVRNDSAALFHQYAISLAGVDDIQLMELASRTRHRQYISGLAKCIERDLSLSYQESRAFVQLKEKGKFLFDPKYGGSYSVFNERPLAEEILKYCVQDVCIMPIAWDVYSKKLNPFFRRFVATESARRIHESHSPTFNGKGQHMAKAGNRWANLSIIRPRDIVLESHHTLPEDLLARCLVVMVKGYDDTQQVVAAGSEDSSSSDDVDDLVASLEATNID